MSNRGTTEDRAAAKRSAAPAARGAVVLLGVPGAGKGTQAKRIIGRYGFAHISTGDIFREIGRSGAPLALQVKAYMEKGELIPDELVCATVEDRLSQPDCRAGYVLDGFPRTLQQAQWFLDYARKGRPDGGNGVVVIYLSVGYNDLYRRLAGRRSCPVCGRIYNDFTQPPRVAGACDVDGARLIQRKDDQPDVIRERLIAFEEQTLPLIEYFRGRVPFVQVCGTDPIEKVTASIFDAVDGSGRPA
jgi:adenylate kinase